MQNHLLVSVMYCEMSHSYIYIECIFFLVVSHSLFLFAMWNYLNICFKYQIPEFVYESLEENNIPVNAVSSRTVLLATIIVW
jgi:hypothetical protein